MVPGYVACAPLPFQKSTGAYSEVVPWFQAIFELSFGPPLKLFLWFQAMLPFFLCPVTKVEDWFAIKESIYHNAAWPWHGSIHGLLTSDVRGCSAICLTAQACSLPRTLAVLPRILNNSSGTPPCCRRVFFPRAATGICKQHLCACD